MKNRNRIEKLEEKSIKNNNIDIPCIHDMYKEKVKCNCKKRLDKIKASGRTPRVIDMYSK